MPSVAIKPAFLAVLIVMTAAPLAAAEPLEISVMSFNVRFAYQGHSEAVAENNWDHPQHPRRERVVRVIREDMPDVLGVQEPLHGQIVDMQADFPEFDFYGVGRDDGKTSGEYSGIFYRKDRFKRLDAGSFWLSATPETPGTSFYTAPRAVPRIASWVKLEDQQTGHQFIVFNAHWDHISVPARQQSARLMRKRLKSLIDQDQPAIVMGDFNAREDDVEIIELTGRHDPDSLQLTDSYRLIYPQRDPNEATFNGFRETVAGSRIDYILHTRHWQPTAAAIVRTSYDGFLPSDHYPVTAALRLQAE